MKLILSTTACLLYALILSNAAYSQTSIPLNDLSFFKAPGPSWSIVGEVTADLDKDLVMTSKPGTGILLNLPVNKNGADLYSNTEYGDIDLELDYMMSKGSNSGIYFQGRYEYQLLDSWLVKNPISGDNGGIYERWDETRPPGTKGYQGYAPRQNVSKAPGLWQHVKISFQAPRFDDKGQKIENAKMLRVELNGVLIHENVDLQGPTRGGLEDTGEKAMGPLRLQGDHGTVAFRNVILMNFDKPRPVLTGIMYSVYKGRYETGKDTGKLKPETQGSLNVLSASTINNIPDEFFIKYSGSIKITEAGKYTFNVNVPGGRGILTINGQPVTGERSSPDLPAGNLPFELLYAKGENWKDRSLTLFITGPGIRRFFIGDPLMSEGGETDPIYVDAPVTTILRSFMNLYWGVRSVHAISVGSPEKIHYSYDLDYGAMIQVWRGGFLDATPMWHDRGDGSANALGAVLRFGNPALFLTKLTSLQTAWSKDSSGSGYRPRGYKLNKMDIPTFMYQLDSTMVNDAITVTGEGQGFKREITVKGAPSNLYARLAEAASIQAMDGGMYLVDGRSYYLRIDEPGGAAPVIRDMNGRKELIIPVQNKLVYSILF